jgi:hypothetical protein
MKLGLCLRIRLENVCVLHTGRRLLKNNFNIADSSNLRAVYENQNKEENIKSGTFTNVRDSQFRFFI